MLMPKRKRLDIAGRKILSHYFLLMKIEETGAMFCGVPHIP